MEQVLDLYKINDNRESSAMRGKFWCTALVEGIRIKFEIDTGASVTIMGKIDFRKYFSHLKLESSAIQLVTYCGTALQVLGTVLVRVQYNNKLHKLNLYIINTNRNPLFGREWIRLINLDLSKLVSMNVSPINAIIHSNNTDVNEVLSKYQPLFEKRVEKIKGIQARLRLKPNAQAVFVKSRPIPFALRDRVKEELNNLVKEGVLAPVNTATWASAIMPVVKAKGAIRICGDYKPTLNPNLVVDDHPLPAINEFFTNMSGGQKFSKIDVQQAYLHLEIHSDDREYLTLNTPIGLLQPTRLMYGVASAPAIWQKTMEQMLQGIEGLAIFFDDITVTAPDDATHIKRLSEAFERFHKFNVRINFEKCTFLANEITCCGYRITKDGVSKSPLKVKEIDSISRPENKQELRVFLGLINYYARFIKNLSNIIHPLNNLIRNDVE